MTLFKEIRGNSFDNWIDNKKLLMEKYSVSSRSESYKIKKFCWSCSGKLESSTWTDSMGSNFVQCVKCGLIQSEYLPSEEILGELYNDKLYNDFYDAKAQFLLEFVGLLLLTDWETDHEITDHLD